MLGKAVAAMAFSSSCPALPPWEAGKLVHTHHQCVCVFGGGLLLSGRWLASLFNVTLPQMHQSNLWGLCRSQDVIINSPSELVCVCVWQTSRLFRTSPSPLPSVPGSSAAHQWAISAGVLPLALAWSSEGVVHLQPSAVVCASLTSSSEAKKVSCLRLQPTSRKHLQAYCLSKMQNATSPSWKHHSRYWKQISNFVLIS